MNENESKSLTVRECPVPTVSEPATGQYADMEQLDIQSMFDQLLKQANHAAHEAETHLQVEEKSNSVAELQGFCAGIRNFKSAANKAGFIVPPTLFDTANRMEPWVQQIDNSEDGVDTECNLALDVLNEFSRILDSLTASDSYTALEETIQSEIKAKRKAITKNATQI